MKYFLFAAFISLPSFAHYSKPELLARYSGTDSYNATADLYCSGSEPLSTAQGIYLSCQDSEGFLMAQFGPSFKVLSRAPESQLFSQPVEVGGEVSWYEFNETGVKKLYQQKVSSLQTVELRDLSSHFSTTDAFTPILQGQYIYRVQDESIKLYVWKENELSTLFYTEEAAHLFPPINSSNGDFLMKVRKDHTGENAPDELLLWNGGFHTILKDQDADPLSDWKSFRHQMDFDQGVVAFIGVDQRGEGIFLLDGGVVTEVARAGRELTSFDFFRPKLRDGVLVFRGIDLEGRKAFWVYREGKLSRLITQGDTIHSDKGLARVDYQNRDAIFYGSVGMGPEGEIVLQATLTDAYYPATLLGIGLIRFNP